MSRACKIDSRNTSTKTFFNFTYKRYRFHFRIYTHITSGFSDYTPAKSICRVPAPFLMSDFRRACILHQPLFFKNDVFTHIKNPKKDLNIDNTDSSINPKVYHANLLYTRWNIHRIKRIYSKRSGISYEETIHARDRYSINHLNNKHIYRKKLINFSFRRSHNPRVSKAQEIRFDRAKRCIFHKKEHDPLDLQQHQFATAQRYWFMFTESQFVLKPIKHLLYNQGLHYRNYKFWTPFFGRPGKKIMTNIVKDTPSLNIVRTVAPYNPIPNMFIPHKYRKIISKDPLYTADAERRAQRIRDERIEDEKIMCAKAIYHGTSYNRINRRLALKRRLTERTDYFHAEMTELTTLIRSCNNEEKKQQLFSEMTRFTDRKVTLGLDRRKKLVSSYAIPEGAPQDSSDDSKALEHRPNKYLYTIPTKESKNKFTNNNRSPPNIYSRYNRFELLISPISILFPFAWMTVDINDLDKANSIQLKRKEIVNTSDIQWAVSTLKTCCNLLINRNWTIISKFALTSAARKDDIRRMDDSLRDDESLIGGGGDTITTTSHINTTTTTTALTSQILTSTIGEYSSAEETQESNSIHPSFLHQNMIVPISRLIR
ncbi:hypothetical protein RhiirC2_783404 [Rhizophagus irregularis]|uniref:DUF8211 domain-containing protein n=1 Tax=Rhizophagus irregularis TaxID=588596 RepID=A0A2N1N0V8_9GLOM|nr:hypothetical protein RhiirC2_783404 [Rhizophagus irregularis]